MLTRFAAVITTAITAGSFPAGALALGAAVRKG